MFTETLEQLETMLKKETVKLSNTRKKIAKLKRAIIYRKMKKNQKVRELLSFIPNVDYSGVDLSIFNGDGQEIS